MQLSDIGNLIAFLGGLLHNLLVSWGLPPAAANFVVTLIGVVVVANYGLLIVIFLIWYERKIAARIQDRLGPNRVGPYGLLQTIADVLKLLTKEDIVPDGADKVVYWVAPILGVVSVLPMYAVIPFAVNAYGSNVSVGVLYIVAVGSLGTLAIMLGGWSSNNKYALLGAFRTVAQLVSYEVPMILALLVPVMLAGTMAMNDIVKAQSVWFVVSAPLAAVMFFITSVAEVGRTPFDLLEAESEIVAGFHIEYSGMKFGIWMLAEFMHALMIGSLVITLFFGGWRGPGAEQVPLLGVVYFFTKSMLFYTIVIWIRTTLPRIRIDHMLAFNWKFLTPLALATVILTAVVDKLIPTGMSEWGRAGILFLANAALWMATVGILAASARRMRQAEAALVEMQPAPEAAAHAPAH